ncbi:ATP-dependent DNA helicase [Bauldia sp.]|uniref:ATP-dependent DNA helicase n=1 Tax=Bauldia sp. TaxID=2575872 RepID=UPI003BACC383
MQWSNEQDAALGAIASWLKSPDRPIFRLFGYAGTGKTTLARHIAESVDGTTVFAAYTGKAAHVMRSKGCANAGTIHSLIYRMRGEDESGPTFVRNPDSAARKAGLIIIDECSMVDEVIGKDLLSFGTPVLVLGDPAQLPPVAGGGFFTDAGPDVMLTEVHRQAVDDPIVHLSMIVREGGQLVYGTYGASAVIARDDVDPDTVVNADQVLVGRNATRQSYNARVRQLLGRQIPQPQKGDVLVCLRNDRKRGLLNGSLWQVERVRAPRKGLLRYALLPEDGAGRKGLVATINPAYFDGTVDALSTAARRRSDAFDFGYVLTVHKAQGSQWDDVVLFDESFAFRENAARWLYTGITRAAQRIIIVR